MNHSIIPAGVNGIVEIVQNNANDQPAHLCYNFPIMDLYIAVDIGGTRLRAALYPALGIAPLRQKRISTRGEGGAVARLLNLIAEIWPAEGRVTGIGIAAPGPIDPRKGVIYSAPNIQGWENLALSQIVRERFGVPVLLGNDANLAGLGEWHFGAGQGHTDLLYLTISTGIGGGVISGGRLLLGAYGLAAELGHVTVEPNGSMCGCGHPGHLEAYSSGTAIARFVAAELARGAPSTLPVQPPPTTLEISAAALQGDPLALAAFERAGRYLGIGLANYLHIFNPSIVIFGGGASRSGELLFAPMRAELEKQVISPVYLRNLEIVTAQLGDDAGLLGALALIRDFPA